MTNLEIKALEDAVAGGETMTLDQQAQVLKALGRANRQVIAFKKAVPESAWPDYCKPSPAA